MRPQPLSGPASPAPPCAAADVAVRYVRARTRRATRSAVKARPCLDLAWVGRLLSGARLSASGPALLGALSIFKHVYFSSDFAKSVEIRV